MVTRQAPRRLTSAQLRSLASRGETGRSQISGAVRRQRSRVATTSLRQPQRTRVIRRSISDSVSVRQPRQIIQPTFRSKTARGQASSTFRRVEVSRRTPTRVKQIKLQPKRISTRRFARKVQLKTRTSSIGKPAPTQLTRGQARQRQGQDRSPFKLTIDFADLSSVTRGVQGARQNIRANIFQPTRQAGLQARERFDFFVGDLFNPNDADDFGFSGRGKGGSF